MTVRQLIRLLRQCRMELKVTCAYGDEPEREITNLHFRDKPERILMATKDRGAFKP